MPARLRPWLALVCILPAFLAGGRACAQVLAPPGPGDPVLPPFVLGTPARGDDPAAGHAARFPLFRMSSGFLTEPMGLEDADMFGSEVTEPDDPRMQLVIGSDNPFFDLRAPGEPGGVGYYRLYGQYQLFDSRTTAMAVGLQAATPAGLESNGVGDGPTVFNPSFALSREWGDGTAVHGFISKSMAARAHWADNLERSVRYGLALQTPVPGTPAGSERSCHFFLEALGRSRIGSDVGAGTLTTWEVLPGLHWRLRDTCWISGAFVVPLEAPRPDSRLWQLTWSWRF